MQKPEKKSKRWRVASNQKLLAMGTVIQIGDGKCWLLCSGISVGLCCGTCSGPMLIFVTKNASRFADDLAMGTGIQNPPSKKGASPMGKNKSWACPYSKMCKTWWDFDDFSQKPAFCLVGAHITQVQNNKSQPKRPQPFPRAYFGFLSWHLFSSMKIRVFTQPNAFRR